MTRVKDYDMKLAQEFGQIAQAVISRPNNILKLVEKANDKVDFSNGRFQEIAIDIESIAEDISSKNYESMESLENMFLEKVLTISELRNTMSENNKFYGEQMTSLKAENDFLKQKSNQFVVTNKKALQ